MADENSKKRLGRGLAALIGEMDKPTPAKPVDAPAAPASEAAAPTRVEADRVVPIEFIRANPNNPRQHFLENELNELASSILKHGVVQPILVRPIKGEDLAGAKFEIIAGERRWRASQKAGLHEVPIITRDVGDAQALELAIIENVQRSDLNPVEEAKGYKKLIEEYDYSQAELGEVIGKSRSHVANTLRLLKLDQDLQGMVGSGELSAGHARAIITAKHPARLAKLIIDNNLSVRQAEMLAQEDDPASTLGGKPASFSPTKNKPVDILALERELEDYLGLKVDLTFRQNETGDIKIKYKTLDQLNAICDKLKRP